MAAVLRADPGACPTGHRAAAARGEVPVGAILVSPQGELLASAGNRTEELADPTADVVGLSPIWMTPTKTDAPPALGLDGARELVQAARATVKTVAIGGISAGNARSVIDTGVDGICVVSAVAAAPDPEAAARELLSLWRKP